MENFICSDLEFQDKELNELCKAIRILLLKLVLAYIIFGVIVKVIILKPKITSIIIVINYLQNLVLIENQSQDISLVMKSLFKVQR